MATLTLQAEGAQLFASRWLWLEVFYFHRNMNRPNHFFSHHMWAICTCGPRSNPYTISGWTTTVRIFRSQFFFFFFDNPLLCACTYFLLSSFSVSTLEPAKNKHVGINRETKKLKMFRTFKEKGWIWLKIGIEHEACDVNMANSNLTLNGSVHIVSFKYKQLIFFTCFTHLP